MRNVCLVVLLGLLLAGCANGDKVSDVREGMSKQEVIDTVGKPDGFKRTGDTEILGYTNKLISGWSWNRANYYFVFQNNQLREWGSGEVRVKDPSTGAVLVWPVHHRY